MVQTKNNEKMHIEENKIKGSEILLKTLLDENVDVVFGYPGGTIMPVYDALFDYGKKIRHILARHEQGAIHAAQGYARTTGKTGVVFVTSGPGATNLSTGLADACADSTPIVCISGQVNSNLIGTDAFQEADVVGVTLSITKWNYRLSHINELQNVIKKAIQIASSGRPGPVMIDVAKDVFLAKTKYKNISDANINFENKVQINIDEIEQAAQLINSAYKPLIIFGQGIKIGKAEKEFISFLDKSGIPAAWTVLGKSALPTLHPLNMGMLGMHGNYAVNKMVEQCDLLIAIGMRFDDRVTGNPNIFAQNAKIIHLDIDPSEVNKIKQSTISIIGNVKSTLPILTQFINKRNHNAWRESFAKENAKEKLKILRKYCNRNEHEIFMFYLIQELNHIMKCNAILVTDVGQHQMMVSRYASIEDGGELITSGGIGTMGFGLPAAIGAKVGNPGKPVVAIVGDGGVQMTIQELGTIMQEKLDVKILIINNQFLGMVRQWQELFFSKRYAFTEMKNPSFTTLAEAYNIQNNMIGNISELKEALIKMVNSEGPYLLEVKVAKEENVFPIIPAGMNANDTIFE